MAPTDGGTRYLQTVPVVADGSRIVVEINIESSISSVLFADDGQQVLGGGEDGVIWRWGVDGHEAGEPIRMEDTRVYAAALSPDRKWLVGGLWFSDADQGEYARLWDAQTQEKVLDVKGHTKFVMSVDVSPDSSRFATGSADGLVFVWGLPSGETVMGPLKHDGWVVAVRFSPDGDRVATATAHKSIRVYRTDNGQQLLDIPFECHHCISSPLVWSSDCRRLFAVSHGQVKRFDASSGSLVGQWSIPGGRNTASIALSSNEKFAAVVADESLSFWDVSTGKQIGNVIKHSSWVYSIAISNTCDYIATGEADGKVILRGLSRILPDSYLCVNSDPVSPANLSTFISVQLPFMDITNATFYSWIRNDLTCVDELLTMEMRNPSRHASTLAHRAIVRSRLKRRDAAIDDAKKSVELEQSVIGHIATAVARICDGEHAPAMTAFDLAFQYSLPGETNLLLLMKEVLLFECGKQQDAISHVGALVDKAADKSIFITLQARMLSVLVDILLTRGDIQHAIELLLQAEKAIPFQSTPFLTSISLIFGWDFASLDLTIRMQLQRCVKSIEDDGDAAATAHKLEEATQYYSTALSLGPSNPAGILIKRSGVLGSLKSWEKALTDADEAIKANPASPLACEARYVALRGLGRFDDAFDAFTRMFTLVESSTDEDVCGLTKKYVSPSRSTNKIDDAIREVSKVSPLVLIDVKSGRLCDEQSRRVIFKSEPEFRELLSSMMQKLDEERIQQVVGKFFEYVTLSHVWEGMEPLLQDVNAAGSVRRLDSTSPLNDKLQKFCEVVRTDGYRWAWSDTCCIDKTISTVLNQSLKMMYLWYECSAATFVYLRDVELLLASLKDSKWLTRAWTSQELLSPKVVRFYIGSWKLYRGDTRRNHKDSPEIMQELADAIGIASKTIISFDPDDLSVREKLRLASTRNATKEEDVAYSLIGIFKSDIHPDYGEGYAALGHLLEEIVSRSGEVTVLDWTGKSSQYNSCLPDSLSVYSRPPGPSPALGDVEMDMRVKEMRDSTSRTDTLWLHEQVSSLPPARFANRRLYLPCIIFAVRRLGVQNSAHGHESRYRARAWGIGDVDFYTSDKLSPMEPRKLIFVHPWIRNLCDPPDGFSLGSATDEEGDEGDFTFGPDEDEPTRPSSLHDVPAPPVDGYTQALRLVARLQRPFHALLLQQQLSGEFRRVAAEHEIVVSGVQSGTNFAKDLRAAVVEIL